MNPLSGLPTDIDHLYAKLFWIKSEQLPDGRIRIQIVNERGVVLERWEVRNTEEGAQRLREAGYWHPFGDTSWHIQHERAEHPRR